MWRVLPLLVALRQENENSLALSSEGPAWEHLSTFVPTFDKSRPLGAVGSGVLVRLLFPQEYGIAHIIRKASFAICLDDTTDSCELNSLTFKWTRCKFRIQIHVIASFKIFREPNLANTYSRARSNLRKLAELWRDMAE
jgi:hypothetical protein